MSVEFFPIASRFRSIEFVEDSGRMNITAEFRHVDWAISTSMRSVTDSDRHMVVAAAQGFFNTHQPVFQQSCIDGSPRTFRHPRHRGFNGSHVISEHGEVVATDEMERRVEALRHRLPSGDAPVAGCSCEGLLAVDLLLLTESGAEGR